MKNMKIPAFVTVVILTTITLVFWVFFSVYRVFTQKPSPNIPANILEPVNPALDKDTLTRLEGRTFFEEGQIPVIPIGTPTPTPTATPEATLTPTATPSATPTATPSATPTGTVTP